MKKTIRVKFVGFWDGFVAEKTRIYLDLAKLYNIEITDSPDYIICSCFAPYYDYCNYPQVRIMDVGENYIPDMNLVDYAISRYPVSLLDRCFFHPGVLTLEVVLKRYGNKKKNEKLFIRKRSSTLLILLPAMSPKIIYEAISSNCFLSIKE